MRGMFVKGMTFAFAVFAIGSVSASSKDKSRDDYRGDKKTCSCDRAPERCDHVNLCAPYPTTLCNFLHLDVGFLVEKMVVSGTEYAHTVQGVNAPSDGRGLPRRGRILRPCFDMNWGITASLGYYFNHDDWFFLTKFDWLRGKGRQEINCGFGESVIPHGTFMQELSGGSAISTYQAARSRFRADTYHLVSVLERGVNLTDRFSIHPAGGLELDWIQIQHNSRFAPTSSCRTDIVHHQGSKFWGIGPHVCFEGRFHFFGEMLGFSSVGTGLVFGETRVYDTSYYEGNSATYRTDMWARNCDCHFTMSPSLVLGLGVMCDKMICDETQRLIVRASFDTALWWNQNHTIWASDANILPTFWLTEEHYLARIGFKLSLEYEF